MTDQPQPAPSHESAPPSGTATLSPATLLLIEQVLRADTRDALNERLHAAARASVDEARRKELSAERMIITIKDAWWELPELRRLSSTVARNRLEGLVSESIRIFYASDGRDDGAPSARPPAPDPRFDR